VQSHFVGRGRLANRGRQELSVVRTPALARRKELVGAAVIVREEYPRLVLSDKSLRLVLNTTMVRPEFLLLALRLPEARSFIEDRRDSWERCSGWRRNERNWWTRPASSLKRFPHYPLLTCGAHLPGSVEGF